MFASRWFRGSLVVLGLGGIFVAGTRCDEEAKDSQAGVDSATGADGAPVSWFPTSRPSPLQWISAWLAPDAPDAPATDRADAPTTEHERVLGAARAHLASVAASYELDEADLATIVHRDTHIAPDRTSIVRFAQSIDGRPIIGRAVNVVMTWDDEVVGATGRLASSSAIRRARALLPRAQRTDASAVSTALAQVSVGTRGALERHPSTNGDFTRFAPKAKEGPFVGARVRDVFVEHEGRLVPAHHVELETNARPEDAFVSSFVSSIDGASLRVVRHAHADTFRVHADSWPPYAPYDSPGGTSATPHPTGTPSGYTPAFVAPQLVTLSSSPFSRNDRWLPPNATELSGNTVLAYVDRAAPDGFTPGTDLAVPPTTPGTFDRVFDPSLSPTASDEQSCASATQAFFVAAFLHDFFYDAGFDERAGNAQASNFGRGGLEGDRIHLEVQDYALPGRSLAIIPPDGSTPRLSFGIYPGAGGAVARDAAMDATLVAHEWGHLLSERLVGNALGLGNGQGRAIGEGTSDFLALLLVTRPEDVNVPGNYMFQGVYPIGGYAASGADSNAHYFGLRRAPYSTDFARNALSFRHVARGVALPSTHPIREGRGAVDNPVAHAAGEIWALALWESYVSLLRAHPFMEAQDRMKQYLVRGLLATPISPTFVEARDALLAVTSASDPADASRFRAAFARRGLGSDAIAPARSSVDLVGAVEDTTAGAVVRVASIELDDSQSPCDADGVLDVGETGLLRVTVVNPGLDPLPPFNATVTASGASSTLSFPAGNSRFVGALPATKTATFTLPVALTAVSTAEPNGSLTISFDLPSVPAAQRTHTYHARVHHDVKLAASTIDTMSTRTRSWTLARNGAAQTLAPTFEGGNDHAHLEDGPTRGTVALVSPPLRVTAALSLSFRMRHSLAVADDGTTATDGAVIELSEDGVHFVDVTTLGAAPGYTGMLANDVGNPLGARAAFTGMSEGFPSFVTRTLDFGNALVGKIVFVRFVVGANGDGRSAHGLDIDDVAVVGVDGTPFAARVAETSNGTTCNRPPAVNAGSDMLVSELDGDPALGVRRTVALSGASAFDPDGDALTFAWTQLAGPPVMLSANDVLHPTFVTPAIGADVVLVFRLDVGDGTNTSSDVVRVTIRNDNRAPTAILTGPSSVTADTAGVTLDGSGSSDPDGDALTYTWTQTSGPSVALVAKQDVATFDAPSVSAPVTLGFALVVSDGIASSAPATLSVDLVPAPIPDAGAPPADGGAPATPGGGSPSDGGAPGEDSPSGHGATTPAAEDGGCAMVATTNARGLSSSVALGLGLGLVTLARRRLLRRRLVDRG